MEIMKMGFHSCKINCSKRDAGYVASLMIFQNSFKDILSETLNSYIKGIFKFLKQIGK